MLAWVAGELLAPEALQPTQFKGDGLRVTILVGLSEETKWTSGRRRRKARDEIENPTLAKRARGTGKIAAARASFRRDIVRAACAS
jgi:hypothetical protein